MVYKTLSAVPSAKAATASRAALKDCGYDSPPTQITIHLPPPDIRKEATGFDLPMALGITPWRSE